MNQNQTSYAWRYLTDLTELLPHRASASLAELRAAEWLTERLQHLGYTVERQEFTAPRDTLYAGPPFVFLGVLAAGTVGVAWPLVGAALAVLFSLPMIGDMLGKPWDFDLLLNQHRSRNVVARRGDDSKPPRLVIMAHYDTQKGSLLFHPRFASFITPLFTLAYVGLAVIPLALIVRAIWPAAAWTGLVTWVAGLVLLAVAAFLTLCRYTGRYINGANDNGSGTAVALALAQRLAEAGDEKAGDVVFVFTGSEEVGERGAKHYFRTTGRSLSHERTRVINLDNIGRGRLHYLLGEGMLAYQPYDRELIALAEQRASREESGFLTPVKNLLLPTDGLMATVYRFRAITFIAMDEQGRIPHYHWHTDILANVDRDLVEREEDLLWRYLGDVRASLEQTG